MSNQENKNNGLTLPFKVIAGFIAAVLIAAFFVPGNAIHDAPLTNKILAGVFAGAAVWWGIQFSKDRFTLVLDHRLNTILHLAVLAALIALALLTLVVWHGGPLGTTTNPA